MAKLGKPYPMPQWKTGKYKSVQEWLDEQDRVLDSIPADKSILFPMADGYAMYYVESLSPLILRHIDYADGYTVQDWVIRGLRRSDVEEMIECDARTRKLFSGE